MFRSDSDSDSTPTPPLSVASSKASSKPIPVRASLPRACKHKRNPVSPYEHHFESPYVTPPTRRPPTYPHYQSDSSTPTTIGSTTPFAPFPRLEQLLPPVGHSLSAADLGLDSDSDPEPVPIPQVILIRDIDAAELNQRLNNIELRLQAIQDFCENIYREI